MTAPFLYICSVSALAASSFFSFSDPFSSDTYSFFGQAETSAPCLNTREINKRKNPVTSEVEEDNSISFISGDIIRAMASAIPVPTATANEEIMQISPRLKHSLEPSWVNGVLSLITRLKYFSPKYAHTASPAHTIEPAIQAEHAAAKSSPCSESILITILPNIGMIIEEIRHNAHPTVQTIKTIFVTILATLNIAIIVDKVLFIIMSLFFTFCTVIINLFLRIVKRILINCSLSVCLKNANGIKQLHVYKQNVTVKP